MPRVKLHTHNATIAAGVLAALAMVAWPGPPARAADTIWCHDVERSIVARKSRRKCTGEVVDAEEARRIKRQRVERIQRVLERERNPLVPGKRLAGTGTGFFISPAGHVLTNEHVVRDCEAISVTPAGQPEIVATLRGADPSRDLALLETGTARAASAALREANGVNPGEGVTVVGYPLHGRVVIKPVLVSGRLHEKGPPPETGVFAMNIDVRRGNSGGPVLDGTGQVIGVVVAKVDTPTVYAKTGERISDVGLGIRLPVVRAFLRANSLEPLVAPSRTPLGPDAMFARAREFVAQIGCWR